MSFLSALKDTATSLFTGFTPTTLSFEESNITVATTALLAEGGYSFVYSAREVGAASSPRTFAAKKVLVQDDETQEVAEVEARLLKTLDGQPGFVRCFGTMTKRQPNSKSIEHWFLLEFCENGSLVDLLFCKVAARAGEYEKREPLAQSRVLEIIDGLLAAVAHMHSLDPPVAHRDLKLENVLGTGDGRFVLCDFGSATTTVLPTTRTRSEALAEEDRIQKYSTLMYRAPEMVDLYRNQEVGVKVDVWALGCILFSLCFREHPFADESSLQILNGAYSIPADSPYEACVHDLIRLMLADDPAVRPSATEALQRVRAMRHGGSGGQVAAQPSAAAAEGPAPTPERPALSDAAPGSMTALAKARILWSSSPEPRDDGEGSSDEVAGGQEEEEEEATEEEEEATEEEEEEQQQREDVLEAVDIAEAPADDVEAVSATTASVDEIVAAAPREDRAFEGEGAEDGPHADAPDAPAMLSSSVASPAPALPVPPSPSSSSSASVGRPALPPVHEGFPLEHWRSIVDALAKEQHRLDAERRAIRQVAA